MSLRTVADETPRLCRSTMPLEPTGSLVATKSATIARSTAMRRSSLFIVVGPPPTRLARTRLSIVGETRSPGRTCVSRGGSGPRRREELPHPHRARAGREQPLDAAHHDAGRLGGVAVGERVL